MKIACWSGPRNISTALMRSWSSRNDTFVSDEPFYAYYLKEKKLEHPMYKEIIDHYPNEYKDVVNYLNSMNPQGEKIWYQKHMAHHLINFNKIDWIQQFENCILIRHPKDVITSYVKKNILHDANELGYPQQYKIIKYLDNLGEKFVVIDSEILLQNPEKILSKWCDKIDIKFDQSMLKWEKGVYPNDGIWWKHWYDSVINTTGFTESSKMNSKISKKYQSVYNECLFYYKKIYQFIIK